MTVSELRALPIIDRPVDNTALAAYMECPWKYYAGMVEHRRRSGNPPPAIVYGTTWHTIMETHYKTGGDRTAVQIAAADSWVDHGKPDDHRTLPRALMEYEMYLRKWGVRPELEEAQTLGWPEQPMVELSVNASWEGGRHSYAGKIDRLIEWNGQLYVEDHKTTSQFGSPAIYFGQFDPDNQMMGYAWLAHQLTGRWIAGVRINLHCVRKASSEFARETISFSKDRLEDWAENYNLWVERLEHSYVNNFWPRNFKACAGKYGMCTYASVCALSPKIRQRALESDFDVIPWNPLEVKDDSPGSD